MTGYTHPQYAQSLSEFGVAREMPACGGWVLERRIPNSQARDAMGCYPLFTCRDWARLGDDLSAISTDLVALSLVTDPFGLYQLEDLYSWFDRVVSFKEHFVYDLQQSAEHAVHSHHRYYARKALKSVRVDVCAEPRAFAGEWAELYGALVERHHLGGIKAFSEASFAKQLAVPGIVALRAEIAGSVVGGQLWYIQGDVAYSHLTALSQEGYRSRAAYAIYWSALAYFAGRVRWLDLGAGAGLSAADDGLTQFKRGWATGTRPAYFCGRIFDHSTYTELVRERGAPETTYFPAYRYGELQ